MNSRLNPYLGFINNSRSAIEFYKTVFGGKLEITTFKEGGMSKGPETDNLTMHAMLTADNGIVIMASDKPPGMPYSEGSNISMSLSGENEEELRGYWTKLAEGGKITMPLEKSPWEDIFGMLTDKFGIDWMVNISKAKA